MSSGTHRAPVQLAEAARRRRAAGAAAGERHQGARCGCTSPVVICLVWIIPTFGLAITSFRTRDAANSSGWWTVFTCPAT